jgi:hypothetical protein
MALLTSAVFLLSNKTFPTKYPSFGKFGDLLTQMASDDKVLVKNKLMGPSLATGDWTPEMLWDTGFTVPTYTNSLYALAMEQCVIRLVSSTVHSLP